MMGKTRGENPVQSTMFQRVTLKPCWSVACFLIIIIIIAFQPYGIRTEEFSVMTPSVPDSDLDLHSCLQTAADGDNGDREMSVTPTDGSLTSQSLGVTTSNADCVDISASSFQFDMASDGESARVRIHTSDVTYHDAYLPLAASCLGHEYMISTWSPSTSGISFAAVFNPSSQPLIVNVSLDVDAQQLSLDADGLSLTPGALVTWQIPSYQTKYVTSSSYTLDGVVISGTDKMAVYAGNVNTVVFYLGYENHFLEMFPPSSFFHCEYLVPMPTGLLYAMIKVVALNAGQTTVTATTYDTVAGQSSSNTLTRPGAAWTIFQSLDILVRSDQEVMVVQYCPDASFTSSPSMAVIPPVTQWASSILVHPLVDSSNLDLHTAEVIALTNETNDITLQNVSNDTDVTSSILFTPIGQSGFSKATLVFSSATDLIWLQAPTHVKFQVIQYHTGEGQQSRAYSFRAGLHAACLPNTTTPTNNTDKASSTDDSALEKLKLYPISDTAIYAIVSSFGLVLIVTTITLSLVLRSREKEKQPTRFPEVGPPKKVETGNARKIIHVLPKKS